jgi:hypothetical protein
MSSVRTLRLGYVRRDASDASRDELRKGVWFPSLIFTAYHPDVILIFDSSKGNTLVNCPTGPYHSALAFFAHRAGLPVEAALLYSIATSGPKRPNFCSGKASGAGSISARTFCAGRGAAASCIRSTIQSRMSSMTWRGHLLRGVGRPSGPIDLDNYAVDEIVRG